MNKKQLALIISSAILLSACGDGEGDPEQSFKHHLQGKAMIGNIKGATVFLDMNYNGVLDNDEPRSFTQEDSRYYLELTNAQNECRGTAPLVMKIPAGLNDSVHGEVQEEIYLTRSPILLKENSGEERFNITPFTDLAWNNHFFRDVSHCSEVTTDMLTEYQDGSLLELETGIVNVVDGLDSVSEIYSDYLSTGANIDPSQIHTIQNSIAKAKEDMENRTIDEIAKNTTISYKFLEGFNELVKVVESYETSYEMVDDKNYEINTDSRTIFEVNQATFSEISDLETMTKTRYPIDSPLYEGYTGIDIEAHKNTFTDKYTCKKTEIFNVDKPVIEEDSKSYNKFVMQFAGVLKDKDSVQECFDEKIVHANVLEGSVTPSVFEDIEMRVENSVGKEMDNGDLDNTYTSYYYPAGFDYDQFWSSEEVGDPPTTVWTKDKTWFDDLWALHNKHLSDYTEFHNLMDTFTYEEQGEHSVEGKYQEMDQNGVTKNVEW